MDPFAFLNHQDSNRRNTIRDCSVHETPKINHRQFRYWMKNSNLKFSRRTNWNIEISRNEKHFCQFCPIRTLFRTFFIINWNKINPQKSYRLILWWKNEVSREEIWLWIYWHVKPSCNFPHFWSIKILLHGKNRNNLKQVESFRLRLRPWSKKSSQLFWINTSSKIKLSPSFKQFWHLLYISIRMQERNW